MRTLHKTLNPPPTPYTKHTHKKKSYFHLLHPIHSMIIQTNLQNVHLLHSIYPKTCNHPLTQPYVCAYNLSHKKGRNVSFRVTLKSTTWNCIINHLNETLLSNEINTTDQQIYTFDKL